MKDIIRPILNAYKFDHIDIDSAIEVLITINNREKVKIFWSAFTLGMWVTIVIISIIKYFK